MQFSECSWNSHSRDCKNSFVDSSLNDKQYCSTVDVEVLEGTAEAEGYIKQIRLQKKKIIHIPLEVLAITLMENWIHTEGSSDRQWF